MLTPLFSPDHPLSLCNTHTFLTYVIAGKIMVTGSLGYRSDMLPGSMFLLGVDDQIDYMDGVEENDDRTVTEGQGIWHTSAATFQVE